MNPPNENNILKAERFFSSILDRWMWQWDYRATDGRLYTGISDSEEGAREAAERMGYDPHFECLTCGAAYSNPLTACPGCGEPKCEDCLHQHPAEGFTNA